MNRLVLLFLILSCIGLAGPRPCNAVEQSDTQPVDVKTPTTDQAEDMKPDLNSLTVAILDFDSSSGNAELGKQASDVIIANLSGQAGFTLVDRSTLAKTLQEHQLDLTGLVKSDQAIKIGKLVGARVLVMGKIFTAGKQLFMTAKLIGTETSVVEGVLVNGDKDADIGDLLVKLSEKVAARLREAGPKLVAQPDAGKDPLPDIKKRLAGRKLPIISIHIGERHVTPGPVVPVDPAVETEIHSLFEECGFKVIDGDATQELEAGVTLVISGDAFSEFSGRIGNLVSCAARVELKISDRKTGEVLYSDRETTRAVDLAENIAGKTALQKGGRSVGLRLLEHLAETFSEKPKKKGR